MTVARLAGVALAAVALAGCSAFGHIKSSGAPPGFAECVRDWNASDNEARQSLVARLIVPAGYTRAGIQMSITLGKMVGAQRQPSENPVGCRVIFFKHDRWVAYVARRDGGRFRFRTKLRESDQRGVWPNADQRGPKNARVIGGGKLALRA